MDKAGIDDRSIPVVALKINSERVNCIEFESFAVSCAHFDEEKASLVFGVDEQ